ncbi:MAG: RES family NAD+ phosphorylase, partial [Desulfobacterales bacterium]
MQRAWRIINKKHAVHAFDGEGSRRYGSRWTSPEVRVVHASANLSLALLEVLVHLKVSAPLLAYLVYTVDFSEDLVEELDEDDLPENWRSYPAPAELRVLGDVWFR